MAEIVLPEIVRSWLQPPSESGEPKRANTALQEIGFYAYGKTAAGNSREASFSVLAQETAPQITGGWVKLAKVQRFQRVSVTVPEGYDPRVLTVPIMFDATAPRGAEVQAAEGKVAKAIENGAAQIEENIKALEWMAGREEHPSGEVTGEPPYVQVYTVAKNAKNETIPINLVPSQFQSINGKSHNDSSAIWKAILAVNPKLGNNADKVLPKGTKVKYPEAIKKLVPRQEFPLWYITNLTYDPNPLRARGGNRIRQNVVVELTEIVLSPNALSRAEQEHEANERKYATFKVTGGSNNTIRKIASVLTKGRA